MDSRSEILDDLEAQVAAARALTEYEDRIEPRAVKAWYDPERDLVVFQLKNRCVFGFPPLSDPLVGLAEATPAQLSQVEPESEGEAIRWDAINADVSVPGLLLHLLNVQAWYGKWYGEETSADEVVDGCLTCDVDDFDTQISAARARAEYADRTEPRVTKAWYDTERCLVMLDLKNGCVFGFPPEEAAQWGLAGATPGQLAQVVPDCCGEGLHWEDLDADISVPGLLLHLLNVKAWSGKWFGESAQEARARSGETG